MNKLVKPAYLIPEEVDKLEAGCHKPEDALLVRLLFATGGRISEVLAVRPRDIDFDFQRLTLPALKRKDMETKEVTVDIDTLVRLRQFCKGKSADRRLFTITRQQAYYIIRMAAKRAGLLWANPHLLRFSLGTNWAKKGGDLTILQRQLGHKRFSTTVDQYIRYETEDIRNERERIQI